MTRCVAVMGASNSGKSTLVDRICGLEGGRPPAHVATGETRCVSASFLGDDWMLLDCPGSLEFMQQSMDALMAADAALICVSPDPDHAVLAAPFIRIAEASGVPTLLFVNRMDEARAGARDIAEALQAYSTHPVVLRQIPIREGGNIVGAVDLVSERAWRYREGETSDLIEIPDDLLEREQEARGEFLESLSEYDDWLLEELIEDRAPATGPIYSICARALQQGKINPAFIGSALHGNGVMRLMKALRHETPTVEALASRMPAGSLAATFLARHRKHVGKMVYMRALQPLKTGDKLGGDVLGPLNSAVGEKPTAIAEAGAGDVVAAIKSDHLGAGLAYDANGQTETPAWHTPLSPLFKVVIAPVHEKDDVKLSEALAKLTSEDPSLIAGQDPETGAQVLSGQGPLHLRHMRETLAEVFGVETTEAPIAPQLRETITKKTEVHYRHKKQSGGSGQFADVVMIVAPAKRGEGFSFEETIHGGSVPKNYIPAVEHGAREATEKGPLGFPVVDIKVTLTDGKSHSVDSSDMAFRIAGRGAVREGLGDAAPVLLEPVYDVRIITPSVFTGHLNPMIPTKRGQVLGFDRAEDCSGWDVLRAQLPGSALDDLIADLRSATQGVARFEAEFSHFHELYGRDAERLVALKNELAPAAH